MAGLLEVLVLHEHDARAAQSGGADLVELVGSFDDDWSSPEPALVEKVCRTVSIEVWPLLRLRPGFRTDGGEMTRLKGLASAYLSAGASGIFQGFLDGYARVDVEVLTALTADNHCPWAFDWAFDRCLEPDKEWPRLLSFPTLAQVVTAGSAIDIDHGLEELIAQARANPKVAAKIVAGNGLRPEHIPWLARAGIRAFQLGDQVRPMASRKAYVDEGLVRSWRTLIDDIVSHLEP